jgi:UDP-N-acetylglucosamine 2-epimerase (non-hydrolysing)
MSSNKTKVLSIFGTRPEAIKMAPVIKALEARTDRVISRVCVTAQHRELLDDVLMLFDIVPDHDLSVMQEDQSPTQVAARVLTGLESLLADEQPDWVLVQGDTTSAMATAIAAFYAGIRVGHIEAGLRTRNKLHPFPEEINRRVVGVVADLHFAPTERARQNLLQEGVPEDTIYVTGNPVIDALMWAVSQPLQHDMLSIGMSQLQRALRQAEDARLILVTAHRQENFGKPLTEICRALQEIVELYRDVHIVYPVHLNPNVREPVYRHLSGIPRITLLPPLDYLSIVHLMKRCYLILTDSGGLQEEAPSLGVPVLVLREVTERPEGVEAGTVRVVGTESGRIVAETCRLLDDCEAHAMMAQAANPYGDGQAADRIVRALLSEPLHHFRPQPGDRLSIINGRDRNSKN